MIRMIHGRQASGIHVHDLMIEINGKRLTPESAFAEHIPPDSTSVAFAFLRSQDAARGPL